MSIRCASVLMSSATLALGLVAIGCSGGEDAPPAAPAALTSTTPDANTFVTAPPATTGTALPPLADYDAGATDAVAPVATDAAPVACPGGESEVEPNDLATPNLLTTARCGVLGPGDVDHLSVTQGAFNVEWTGAISVEAIPPTVPGGPYILKITSQTPSVATPWTLRFK